jgi:hypothetical protein
VNSHVFELFDECARAIRERILIVRASPTDKEFHFQNWIGDRFEELGLTPLKAKRNSFPDFALPSPPEGYEVKGLEFPGRYQNYDSNSQVPTGSHGGWSPIYYIFGRYPKGAGTRYPVTDLVLCHGDFLNATHDYVHKNKHIKGFGSYGDIMIRDRKMYVVPTPYALTEGMEGEITLVVPAGEAVPGHLLLVGDLVRTETERLLAGYRFNLRTNEIGVDYLDNPDAGREHAFRAYRHQGAGAEQTVSMRDVVQVIQEELLVEEGSEEESD